MGITARLLIGIACSVALLGIAAQTNATGIVLYDGALGTPPGAQQMILGMEPFPPGAPIETLFADSIELNTLDTPDRKAGYAGLPQRTPMLDRQAGFTVRFTVQLQAEAHTRPDRAGLSIIVLADDGVGIEVSFWEAEIWAQATEPVLFTHGEGATFDTTQRRTYDLTIQNDGYALTADSELILSGPLRNYSAFGLPYNQTNFIFIGDNTTSAGAQIRLYDVAIITTTLPTPTFTPLPTFTPSPCPTEAFVSFTGSHTRPGVSGAECFGPTITPTPSVTPSLTPAPSATIPAGAPTNLFRIYLPLNQGPACQTEASAC